MKQETSPLRRFFRCAATWNDEFVLPTPSATEAGGISPEAVTASDASILVTHSIAQNAIEWA
jgi:hypothetical protein